MQVNSNWSTMAEVKKLGGGLTYGYKAKASTQLLRWCQAHHIVVEVRTEKNGKPQKEDFRLIQPDNTDDQVFGPDKVFCIMDYNMTFKKLEKALIEEGTNLPDTRFDDLLKVRNQTSWGRMGVNDTRGYYLDLSRISPEQRKKLSQEIAQYVTSIQGDRYIVSDKKQVSQLEAKNKWNIHPNLTKEYK